MDNFFALEKQGLREIVTILTQKLWITKKILRDQGLRKIVTPVKKILMWRHRKEQVGNMSVSKFAVKQCMPPLGNPHKKGIPEFI